LKCVKVGNDVKVSSVNGILLQLFLDRLKLTASDDCIIFLIWF